MVEWHHQLNGHKFEQTLGDSEGQGSLACCSPWGHKESDTKSLATEQRQCRRESLCLLLCILYLDLESDSILIYFMFALFLVLATVYI